MNHPIIITLDILDRLFSLIMTTWIYLFQCTVIVLVVVAFIPDVSFFEFVQKIANITIIAPAVFVFEFFNNTAEYFRNVGSVNDLHAFANLVGMLASIILMFAIPAIFWFFHILIAFSVLFKLLMPTIILDNINVGGSRTTTTNSIFDRNDLYLATGRTNVEDIFSAEVEATAIASALKK